MIKDNQQLRELFSLPPIRSSASTAIDFPQTPPQEVITGDKEVDAVLWLQKVVATGNSALINKALESAKAIKTDMKTLGMRYADHIARTTGNTLAAAFSSFGFGDLESQAERAISRAARRHEALSRFGTEEALFTNTPAEDACVMALNRAKKSNQHGFTCYDETVAAKRFAKHAALSPASIGDCLYVMSYWRSLYFLRNASVDFAGDPTHQASAHEDYCFSMLASIAPRNEQEAVQAFNYIREQGWEDRKETPAIYLNLIVSGWRA